MLLLSGLLVTLSFTCIAALSLNAACKTPGGNAGRCVPEGSCQFIKELKQDYSNQRYVAKFSCGSHSRGRRLVCCPELQNESNCGREEFTSIRIVGGDDTKVDEYPWTALLGYQLIGKNGSPIGGLLFSCGGTLIADRYVVTAAHCVEKGALGRLKLVKVRLGEWNLSTEYDCIDGRCYQYEDISIEKVIIHELYETTQRNKEHDIALLKLARGATYQDTIATICLPTAADIMINRLNMKDEEFDVAGWGVDETDNFSEVKQKVTLKGKHLDVCQLAFGKHSIHLTSNHLCVGGDGGTGACRGDSGGPLMISKNDRWHLAGVVSMGPRECDTKGIPGIYTNVANYLDWMAARIELESRT